MLNLPTAIMALLEPFRPVFHESTWHKVQVLVVGSILAPGKRTISAVLRVVGLADEPGFTKYHQVLNRAVWSSRQASQVLLNLLLGTLGHESGPLVFGIDDTIERRWGAKIQARGIYRDAVRSSHTHFVKASGLRWLSLMWLTPVPWAQRIWALPFVTVLAPSERFYQDKVRSHKKLTDWARQMIYQLRRWLPKCELVVVGDNSFAVLDLLHACQKLANPVTLVSRLRLDAALYEPAPPYSGLGRPRLKGRRLPTLQTLLHADTTEWIERSVPWYQGTLRSMEIASASAVWYHTGKPPVPMRWVLIRDPQEEYQTVALLSTNLTHTPEQIIDWFIRRWSIEVTFEESRAHLGVETQRQWSDLAILRTTPALLGLFSWVTLVAHSLFQTQAPPIQQAAWYAFGLPEPRPAWMSMGEWEHQLWTHAELGATFRPAVAAWSYSARFNSPAGPIELLHFPRDLDGNFLMPSVAPKTGEAADALFQSQAHFIFYGHHHKPANLVGATTQYMNPGSLGCTEQPVARIAFLVVRNAQDWELSVSFIPYDPAGLFEEFDRRSVPERDFIRRIFMPFASRASVA